MQRQVSVWSVPLCSRPAKTTSPKMTTLEWWIWVFFSFCVVLNQIVLTTVIRFCADLTVLVRFLNFYQHSYSNITSWNACSHARCSSILCPDSCHIQSISCLKYVCVLTKGTGKHPIWIQPCQGRVCSHLLISATC